MTKTWAPGWYPDPNAPGTHRYYDGTAWTEQTAPSPPEKPDSFRQVAIVAVGILVAVVVVWFVYSIATANDDLDCATRNLEAAQNGQPVEDCD